MKFTASPADTKEAVTRIARFVLKLD